MYAILDIESTGGKYNEEGIMEIAIYRFDGHKVTDKFMSLLDPEREIQPFVANLTGINSKMLRSAPKFHEVAKRIIEITQDAILVAHNAQFDYRILRTEFRRLGYDYQRKTLCTVDLSKKLMPDAESHSLGKLVRSLGIAVSDRHRATGDALATLKLFKLLLAKDSSKSIIKEVVRKKAHGELSPTQLDIVETLPSETGVYYMHNKKGEILYVGKTKNIKKRVNQHFTNVGELARKLQKNAKKVNFELTGSELVALLKEYHEVRKLKPEFNTLNNSGFSHGVYIKKQPNGKLVLRPEQANGQEWRVSSFTSLKSGKSFVSKIEEQFELNTTDDITAHNEQINQIYETFSINNRNVLLLDRGRELGEQSAVLIKNGQLQGYGYVELNHQLENSKTIENLITPMKSDKTTTLLIESYLRKNPRIKKKELTFNN